MKSPQRRARLLELLRQDATPERLALSLTLGLALGVSPLLGATTLLCLAAALSLRLNLAAMQLVNYLAYPLQLALLWPFAKLGAWLFAAPLPAAAAWLPNRGAAHAAAWRDGLRLLGVTTLHALAAWVLVSATVGGLLYSVILQGVRRLRPAGAAA